MKKITSILGLTLMNAMILVSCGGSDKTIVTVDKVSIIGDSKDYIAVVPGAYEIKKSTGTFGEELSLSIKFKVTTSFDQSKIGEYTAIGSLSLQIIDGSGSPINLDFSPSGVADWDKIKSLLKGKPGDEVTVLFKSKAMSTTEEVIAEVLKNGKGIEITRADIINLVTNPIIDNSASADGGDCKQFYFDYEAFAEDYIDFIKKYKAHPSDPNVISEYTEMATKAAEMQDDLATCTDPHYAPKLMKLTAKITNALSGI